MNHIPSKPDNSYRVVIELTFTSRLDAVLLDALRTQKDILDLKNISRTAFKELFKQNRVKIKGQNAKPSSMLAIGTTYVDVLGFSK